jgi:uncharacterized membrane protein (DUF485 family)
MAGLDHHSVDEQEPDDPQTARRNAHYGMMLFVIYLAVYSGFVLLNAFRPDLMERTPLAGVNLAVIYGLGLIIGAFVLSLIYGWLCRAPVAGDDWRPGGAR